MYTQFIREQDPLKQGLKPDDDFIKAVDECIREQDPLKQGLKQQLSYSRVGL